MKNGYVQGVKLDYIIMPQGLHAFWHWKGVACSRIAFLVPAITHTPLLYGYPPKTCDLGTS
jgi:hypothetical protein